MQFMCRADPTCQCDVLCSFLPARPDKNIIEARRMTGTFIEERRIGLERYLNRLAAHPAAARSEVSFVGPSSRLSTEFTCTHASLHPDCQVL